MGTTVALPILGAVTSGLGMVQQARAQEAAYKADTAYRQQRFELEERQRAQARDSAERQYEVDRRWLQEETARQRNRSLLEFEREERERLRKLRTASGAVAAGVAARGVAAGGTAAAIQRGLERQSEEIAAQAAEDRTEFERRLAEDAELNAYDLERQRYETLAGLTHASSAGALEVAHRRQQNLLEITERRTRARLGLFDTFDGTARSLAGAWETRR